MKIFICLYMNGYYYPGTKVTMDNGNGTTSTYISNS